MDMPKSTAGIDLWLDELRALLILLRKQLSYHLIKLFWSGFVQNSNGSKIKLCKPVPTVTIVRPVGCDVLMQIKAILKLNCR